MACVFLVPGYGMVWYGMVWYGMVWYGMLWYGMLWYGMVWYGMLWYGMVWYGMVWYGMVWYTGLEVCRLSFKHKTFVPGDEVSLDVHRDGVHKRVVFCLKAIV